MASPMRGAPGSPAEGCSARDLLEQAQRLTAHYEQQTLDLSHRSLTATRGAAARRSRVGEHQSSVTGMLADEVQFLREQLAAAREREAGQKAESDAQFKVMAGRLRELTELVNKLEGERWEVKDAADRLASERAALSKQRVQLEDQMQTAAAGVNSSSRRQGANPGDAPDRAALSSAATTTSNTPLSPGESTSL